MIALSILPILKIKIYIQSKLLIIFKDLFYEFSTILRK